MAKKLQYLILKGNEKTTLKIENTISKFNAKSVSFGSALLLQSIISSTMNATDEKIIATLESLILLNHSSSFWFWLGIGFISITPTIKYYLGSIRKKWGYDGYIDFLLKEHVNNKFQKHALQGLGWDDQINILNPGDIKRGWKANEINVNNDEQTFTMPNKYAKEYSNYLEANKEDFKVDGVKLMVANNPTEFIDGGVPKLNLMYTKYSQAKFVADYLSNDELISEKVLEDFFKNKEATLPHAFCMHYIIETKELGNNSNNIIATLSHPDKGYNRDSWSFTFEEQLKIEDIDKNNPKNTLLNLAKRGLQEELGIVNYGKEVIWNPKNLSFHSIFMEGNFLNVSIFAYLKLEVDSRRVQNIFKKHSEGDNEIQEIDFYPVEKIIELLDDKHEKYKGKNFHSSSKYRIMMYALKNKGYPEFVSELVQTLGK